MFKYAVHLIKDIVEVWDTFSVQYAYFTIGDRDYRFKIPLAHGEKCYELDIQNKPTFDWQDLYATESIDDMREYIQKLKDMEI